MNLHLAQGRGLLDASAVVRIIEGSALPSEFQDAVLAADLVLAPALLLTEVANALEGWVAVAKACGLNSRQIERMRSAFEHPERML